MLAFLALPGLALAADPSPAPTDAGVPVDVPMETTPSVAAPSTLHTAVWGQLMLRDGFAGCGQLFALGDPAAIRDELIAATGTQMPPWAPIRAAECLVWRAGDDPVALGAVKGWMTDPAVPGLALAAVENLDKLPEQDAVDVAKLAVERTKTDKQFAKYAPEPLKACKYDGVKAVAATLDGGGDEKGKKQR